MPGDVLLAIDVGNSRVKYGTFDARARPGAGALPACAAVVSLSHDEALAEAPCHRVAPGCRVVRALLAGVNPPAMTALQERWPRGHWPMPVVVDAAAMRHMPCRVAADQVGIDRLLSAFAANRLRPPGRCAIVVGAGTATTIDLVSAEGVFEGGAIMPGLELGARSLHHFTALLPLIDVHDLRAGSHIPPGKTTGDAMAAGLLWGHVGAIRELASRLLEAGGGRGELLVTGGAGRLLADCLGPPARHEPHLVLRGLALAGWPADRAPDENVP